MRTMLSGREDLIAPHPPHIMRDFMPILGKYGDLDSIDNLKVSTRSHCVDKLYEIHAMTTNKRTDNQLLLPIFPIVGACRSCLCFC